ncbi:MAG: hypothetical protein M1827_005563 [Pycnora praestabilis]|nr:MAG: hypothetical protein M1827_005563 [Pycnora praestabilis]
MADPLSIIASTTGIIDVCVRVAKYLKDVKDAAGKIEQDLLALLEEFNGLQAVNYSIHNTWLDHQKAVDPKAPAYEPLIETQWQDLNHALCGCSKSVLRLGALIEEVVGKDGHSVTSKLDGIKKVLRKQSKDKEILEIRQQVMSHRDNLQVLLLALNLYVFSTRDWSGTDALVEGPILEARRPRSVTRSFRASVTSATDAVASVKLNKHFHVPRAVSSIYTGREPLLDQLKSALSQADLSIQKRFVVYGMGGSGKTEFCLKFAQDYRNSFWGIFCIDGKSKETIRHTFSNIAKIGGVEPNELAAKNWLANLAYPWLLLIDNADDRNMDLQKHFPAGERGFLLITTRNPYNRTLGTVGEKFYDFEKETLDVDESNELLLKAADESQRITSVRDAAARIAERLGYLPLALVQAGKAIFRHMCTCNLYNYLDIYDQSWQRIRRARSLSGLRSSLNNDEVVNMKNVYSSYEIIYRGLENTPALSTQDAIDLLKLFSFLSNESLRMEVLVTAVRHPQRQRQYDEDQAAKKATTTDVASNSWTSTLKECLIWLQRQVDKSVPVLPAVLREETYDEARLGDAMDQLESLSLVNYHREDNSYSMHPLIHTWVRERPEMSNAEQAMWCQAASSTLAQSILLPPLDLIESAEALRRHLLPHVSHVQMCRESIKLKLIDNQKSRNRFWRPLAPTLSRQLALEFGKFSLVYFTNGLYLQAEELQLKVKDYVCGQLGMGNQLAWRVTLALSATYFELTRTNKAAELQAQVLDSCKQTLGPDNPQTLKFMDILGASRCFQGRWAESRELHEKAIEGMNKVLGPDHEDMFLATDNLGKVMWRYFQYKLSHDLHAKAFQGLSKAKSFGPTHAKTLEAKECLALSCIDVLGADLQSARNMMLQVKRERKLRLGTEQPWTLLARCNLARIESAMGDNAKAEKLIRKALPVAQRNLGENHFGTLLGKTHLAQVLVRQKRYDEAEDMFMDIIQRHRYESAARDDGEHPDRISAMRYLLMCYAEHGKFRDALDMCDQLQEAISTIGGQGLGLLHPIAKWIEAMREDFKRKVKISGETKGLIFGS